MRNTKEKLKRILKSDISWEIPKSIPKGAVTFLLSSPAMIFFIAIAVVLFRSLTLFKSYCTDIYSINRDATIMGLIALTAYLLSSCHGTFFRGVDWMDAFFYLAQWSYRSGTGR